MDIRLAMIAVVFGAGVAGCSAAGASDDTNGFDADTGNEPDGASPDGTFNPLHATSSIVLVDSLVNGNVHGNAGDVRVCVKGTMTSTTYAVPDDVTLPRTNIPGVHRGGGVDLGSFADDGLVTISVFSAQDLQTDSAWSSGDRSSFSCSAIACTNGALCKTHVDLTATLGGGVNVIALVDAPAGDAGAGGIALVQTSFEDQGYTGLFSSLYGTVVNFSGWHAKDTVAAFYGTADGGGEVDGSLFNPLDAGVAAPPVLIAGQLTSYETLGIRFDESSGGQLGADRFWQSLDSIAFVSNQTIDPMTFYGHRQNYIFALVGDPSDTTSVAVNGGRDPQFAGTGLHITAIPYSD